MGKKFSVSPLEEIEIQFLDKELVFRFDMRAITKLQEAFGDLEMLAQENKGNEIELIAKLFYSGINEKNFSLDEARVIVSSNAEVLAETLNVVFDSLPKLGGKEVAKKLKEEMEKLKIV